jgi:hypothetical protein
MAGTLSFLAVLVGPDIRGAGRAQISDSPDFHMLSPIASAPRTKEKFSPGPGRAFAPVGPFQFGAGEWQRLSLVSGSGVASKATFRGG